MIYYREVKARERRPNRKGPYYVKVKSPEGAMSVFGHHDIYMWLDGPEEPQREMWIETFDYWLEPIEITEEETDKQKQAYSSKAPKFWSVMLIREHAFKAGVKWALSKLKGE